MSELFDMSGQHSIPMPAGLQRCIDLMHTRRGKKKVPLAIHSDGMQTTDWRKAQKQLARGHQVWLVIIDNTWDESNAFLIVPLQKITRDVNRVKGLIKQLGERFFYAFAIRKPGYDPMLDRKHGTVGGRECGSLADGLWLSGGAIGISSVKDEESGAFSKRGVNAALQEIEWFCRELGYGRVDTWIGCYDRKDREQNPCGELANHLNAGRPNEVP